MREESFKYAIAEKKGRWICIKYTEEWALKAFDYLYDKGYKIIPGSEREYLKQTSDKGYMLECYLLDKELQNFDIGNW